MILAQQTKYSNPAAELAARGSARVVVKGNVVKVRRKGLALLYYLALEGPTSREKLAHTLWGHGNALQNLRVELHRLKDALQPFGVVPFTDNTDPLSIRQGQLVVTVSSGEPLEGLDDISPQYQDWLERQRIKGHQISATSPRTELVDALLRHIEMPYVIVLSGEPGSGRRSVARDLAARMQLPFVIGTGGSTPAVNYVDLAAPTPDNISQAVESGEERLWVLARSAFGIEPELILRLRANVAPERMRFVQLGQLNWWDARQMFIDKTDFAKRARFYLASLGNPRYLNELIKLDASGQVFEDGELPVPLTIRASHALEARNLTKNARAALEKLSCFPGELSTQKLEQVGVSDQLPELEEAGWLRFSPTGWSFSSELARRMVLHAVPVGTRQLHLQTLGGDPAPAAPAHQATGDYSSESRQVSICNEVFLDDPSVSMETARLGEDRVLFSRPGAPGSASTATWEPESKPLLYRLTGRAHSDKGPVPLTIQAGNAAMDVWVEGKFEYFLLLRAGHGLQISSNAQSAVIEFCAGAYRYAEADTDQADPQNLVRALELRKGKATIEQQVAPLGSAATADGSTSDTTNG